jgi:hypothetical protein
MTGERKPWTWPFGRREIVTLGSCLMFAAGLVVIGFGLASENVAFTALGVFTLALPIVRWFRVRREPEGAWTFEGELEKPPDAASEPEPGDEQSRRHSG